MYELCISIIYNLLVQVILESNFGLTVLGQLNLGGIKRFYGRKLFFVFFTLSFNSCLFEGLTEAWSEV